MTSSAHMCCGRSETFILKNKKKILVSMLVLLVTFGFIICLRLFVVA